MHNIHKAFSKATALIGYTDFLSLKQNYLENYY